MNAKASLIRQYELLLVHRHRFVLEDVVQIMKRITLHLQYIESQIVKTSPNKISSANTSQRQVKKPLTYNEVMNNISTRLMVLVNHVPLFLGDAELQVFIRGVREFIRHPDLELFWDLEMNSQEKEIADIITSALQQLATYQTALETSVQESLSIITELRKRRDHLVMFVNTSVQLLSTCNTKRLEEYEDEQVQLMEKFHQALHDPCIIQVKQLQYAITSIEASISMMLLPHFEICRTIQTANAQVKRGDSFTNEIRKEIEVFVQWMLQLKDQTIDYKTVLTDVNDFHQKLRWFEKAANQDAFHVCSSALKLQFQDSMDDELFRAYVGDWDESYQQLEKMKMSQDYQNSCLRISNLKESIVRVKSLIRTSQKQGAMDDPVKKTLNNEIAQLFLEEGGDPNSITPLFV